LWRYVGRFFLPLANRVQNLPANGSLGLVPEEMSQTLLTVTKKKQGKMRLREATNLDEHKQTRGAR
jgi:hypothetical protein